MNLPPKGDISNFIRAQVPIAFELKTATGVLTVHAIGVNGGGTCYLPFSNGIWTAEGFWHLRGATESLCTIKEKVSSDD